MVPASIFEETKEDKELVFHFMRLQGIFSSICSAMMQEVMSQQLDLMGILQKLLSSSEKNQSEFKSVQGYDFVQLLFNTIRDYNSKKACQFLETSFALLEKIIVNGGAPGEGEDDMIENIEAFCVLLEVIGNSEQRAVVVRALECMRRVLSLHPYNYVVFFMNNGFLEMEKLLHRLLLSQEDLSTCALRRRRFQKHAITELLTVKNFEPRTDATGHRTSSKEESKERLEDSFGEGLNSPFFVKKGADFYNSFEEEKREKSEKSAGEETTRSEKMRKNRGSFTTNALSTEEVDAILESFNVLMVEASAALNDVEFFDAPEIYTSFLRKYRGLITQRSAVSLLEATFQIVEDKNCRADHERY